MCARGDDVLRAIAHRDRGPGGNAFLREQPGQQVALVRVAPIQFAAVDAAEPSCEREVFEDPAGEDLWLGCGEIQRVAGRRRRVARSGIEPRDAGLI